MFEFIANSTNGSFSTQSVWLGSTIIRRICPIERLARSEAPSVCGWNAVDINNLVPNILCVSLQNLEVNLGSRSDTIDSGSPCSRTISFIYNEASSDAFVVMFIGMRWTIEVNLHMTTQR